MGGRRRSRALVGIVAVVVVVAAAGYWWLNRPPDRYKPDNSGLYPIKVDGKYGFMDRSGKTVIEPQFDKVGGFSEGLACVRIGTKVGYINTKGAVVITPQFDDGLAFRYGRAPVKLCCGTWATPQKGDRCGFIDKDGKLIGTPVFRWVLWFSGDLAPIAGADGTYGFVNRSGKVVMSGKFEGGGGFTAGLAPTKSGGKWGFIDTAGEWVIDPQFEEAGAFADGLAPVKVGGRWGYIDQKGKFVVNPQYDAADEFYEGYAVFRNEGGLGILDIRGRVVREVKFPANIAAFYPQDLSQYQTPEQVRASHILLKTEGKDENAVKALAEDVLTKAKAPGADFAELAKQYSEDEANANMGGDLGYLEGGEMVPEVDHAAFAAAPGTVTDLVKTSFGFHIIKIVGSKPQTTRLLAAGYFGDGLAPVMTDEGWGFIDHTGKMVVSPQFDSADGFQNGLARVTVAGKEAYLTTAGTFVVNPFPGVEMGSLLSARTLVGEWCGRVSCITVIPLKWPGTFTVKARYMAEYAQSLGRAGETDGIVATLTGNELKGSDGKLNVRVRSKDTIVATFRYAQPDDFLLNHSVLKKRHDESTRR